MENKDIDTRADIKKFLTVFYEKVIRDEPIGITFTKIFPLNLKLHIPV